MASIHRKSKTGTWYITYWQDGKEKHRSLGTQSERKARRLQREIGLTLQDTGYADVVITERPRSEFKNPKADEFWTQFSEWAQTHRSKSAIEEYRAWFTQFVEFAKLDRLGDATPAQVEAFKTKLLSQGKRKPNGVGLQRVSINNALRTLKTVWNHARKLNLYSGENPFYQVEKFRLPQSPDKRFLDGPKVDTLLKAIERYASEKYVKEKPNGFSPKASSCSRICRQDHNGLPRCVQTLRRLAVLRENRHRASQHCYCGFVPAYSPANVSMPSTP